VPARRSSRPGPQLGQRQLYFVDDNGAGGSETLVWTATATATLFVRVYSADGLGPSAGSCSGFDYDVTVGQAAPTPTSIVRPRASDHPGRAQ